MKIFGKGRIKTDAAVDAQRVLMQLSARYSPVRNLTPALLSGALDAFAAGELREFALLAEHILERDDKLAAVEPKRVKSVAGLDWEIVSFEDTPEAARQKQALEAFYGSLSATSAVDEDQGGGVKQLIRYMMRSISLRWSVQEIVWQPGAELTATFRDVPLRYFEHRTSRLRYLASEGDYDGTDMAPGEWLVTRGQGLMVPCSILYLYKHMPLRDWLVYCQRYVVPGLHAETTARKGTAEWNDLVTALRSFGLDWGIVTNEGAKITPIDVSARGELPYPKLVELCDRAMAVLYRGADLSTMSSQAGEGTGASLQESEQDILLGDDIDLVEETLERGVSRHVLRYQLGTDRVLCRFQLVRPTRDNRELEIKTDDALISWGCPVSLTDLLERYGRPQPDAGEELATRPAAGGGMQPGLLPNASGAAALLNAAATGNRAGSVEILAARTDERLQGAARDALARAMADDLAPLRSRISAALANADDGVMLADLAHIPDELPGMLIDICRNPRAEQVLEESLTAALFNGIAEGAARRPDADNTGDADNE